MDAHGRELVAPVKKEIKAMAAEILSQGIQAVAISCLHAYRNPAHEQKITRWLQEEGLSYISPSSTLSPAIKWWPRTQTAIVNAYLSPIIYQYLDNITQSMTALSTQVMTSAGGLADYRQFFPKDSLLSGPAGGMVGAAYKAALSGIHKLITLDMGGTSADIALYTEGFDYQYVTRVGDADIQSPALSIHTIAAGGGSICGLDAAGKCFVGPESAGAFPGPAAYGAGGPLTITDINLLAGHADVDAFSIPVHLEKAIEAFDLIHAQVPDTSPSDLVHAYLQIANEKMAEAIRKITIKKGHNPQDFSLLAFGGAGGQHACGVATLLGLNQIIIPYEAGLLSAYGIALAKPEAIGQKQILLPWEEVADNLEDHFRELESTARDNLVQRGEAKNTIRVKNKWLMLRLSGQEAPLEIEWKSSLMVTEIFREKYEALYGYWIDNRGLELESIKIILEAEGMPTKKASNKAMPYIPQPKKHIKPYFGAESLAVYHWEQLQPGALIKGPALLVSLNATTLVASDWSLTLDIYQNAHLQKDSSKTIMSRNPAAAEIELFKNRFSAIAEEMGAMLERTAFSVNVKERLDFSCALLNPQGLLVANAPHIPVHLGSLGICTRLVLAALPLGPGDVAITNHPGFGGSHLPDITLISGVFDESGHLLGYVANRAHHAEIGGKRPGSMPPDARHLAEEGVVIAPQYLVKKGVIQWEAIQHHLTQGPYPTRSLEENMADLRGGLASIHAGVTALRQLCQKFGHQQVHRYMGKLMDYSSRRLMQALPLQEGERLSALELLDDGTPLQVEISLDQGRLKFDFSGSSATHPGNLNANPAIATSVVLYVLRLIVNEDIPLNEGLLQQVDLILPNGILRPDFSGPAHLCPAVVGGNTETSQRLVDTLLKAFRMSACSQGTMNNLLFGNQHFAYYETIGGGTGAGPHFHGTSGVHQHMTNTRMTDPEVLELRYPVRLHRFGLRTGSGGNGKWKGGEGIVREIEFLDEVALTVLAQHRQVAPYGMEGGLPGACGRQWIVTSEGTVKILSGTEGQTMYPGDRIIIETPGGGGWGGVE
jgi:5-oxoprolinase (ATP-hydrolysing)